MKNKISTPGIISARIRTSAEDETKNAIQTIFSENFFLTDKVKEFIILGVSSYFFTKETLDDAAELPLKEKPTSLSNIKMRLERIRKSCFTLC